ncbi:MAG TPA: BON domain-containing protein [Longimicrobiales bacterium]
MRAAEDIRRDVLEELAWDRSLEAAGIGVAITDGAVTLTGHVGTYAERRAAEKAAKRVKGVMAVANDLDVRLPGSLERDDTDVAAAVAAALRWNVSVPEGVTATVQGGWVTLEGEVDWSYQRHAAERAVRDVIAVRGVTDLISIRTRVRSKQVKEQIEMAFRRSAQVDADHVSVSVIDDRVTLTGTVRSWSERLEAEHAARAAAGVKDVINQLQVTSYTPVLT